MYSELKTHNEKSNREKAFRVYSLRFQKATKTFIYHHKNVWGAVRWRSRGQCNNLIGSHCYLWDCNKETPLHCEHHAPHSLGVVRGCCLFCERGRKKHWKAKQREKEMKKHMKSHMIYAFTVRRQKKKHLSLALKQIVKTVMCFVQTNWIKQLHVDLTGTHRYAWSDTVH